MDGGILLEVELVFDVEDVLMEQALKHRSAVMCCKLWCVELLKYRMFELQVGFVELLLQCLGDFKMGVFQELLY